MSRISKAAVNAVLDRVAQQIVDAGGADRRVSRADLARATASMQGTEKALVDVFYRYVDHRDHRPGATVTAADVQRAAAYAKATLVDAYDVNGNGLSKSEIARMSRTGKLAVQLAQELKRTPEPKEGIVQAGLSFYELRESVRIDATRRFTTREGMDATVEQQIIEACHASTYTHVRTLGDAFGAVDGGEFVVRDFTDPANGKRYTAIDYGAGDSTYGAIFEAGSTTVAFDIHDGELSVRP